MASTAQKLQLPTYAEPLVSVDTKPLQAPPDAAKIRSATIPIVQTAVPAPMLTINEKYIFRNYPSSETKKKFRMDT